MAKGENPAWAVVTPSYSGDYRRCLLLCKSMDHYLQGNWTHYVVVDRPHYDMFKHLQGERRRILLTDDVLPGRMRLLFHAKWFGGRSVWWSRSAGLSVGWHLQQMVKIGIASHLLEAGLAYCDSDTFFMKPFNVAGLTHHGKFRLLRSASPYHFSSAPNPAYTKAAIAMLKLAPEKPYHAYVDNFVTWRRDSVLQLQQQLGANFGGEWRRAFRNRMNVSEYNLYGLFVDELAGPQETHFHTSQSLCKTHWGRKSMTAEEVETFCGNLAPGEVMVGIQSFAGVDQSLLEAQFNKSLQTRHDA